MHGNKNATNTKMVKGAVKNVQKVRVYTCVICMFNYIFIYVYLYVYLPCIMFVCIYIFNTII